VQVRRQISFTLANIFCDGIYTPCAQNLATGGLPVCARAGSAAGYPQAVRWAVDKAVDNCMAKLLRLARYSAALHYSPLFTTGQT